MWYKWQIQQNHVYFDDINYFFTPISLYSQNSIPISFDEFSYYFLSLLLFFTVKYYRFVLFLNLIILFHFTASDSRFFLLIIILIQHVFFLSFKYDFLRMNFVNNIDFIINCYKLIIWNLNNRELFRNKYTSVFYHVIWSFIIKFWGLHHVFIFPILFPTIHFL